MTSISTNGSMMLQMQQMMFQKADADGSGAITENEFSVAAAQGPQGAQGGNPSKAFAQFDSNSDGQLSKDEFSTGFQKMADKMKSVLLGAQEQSGQSGQPDILKLFEKVDSDKDGKLSKNEIENLSKGDQKDDFSLAIAQHRQSMALQLMQGSTSDEEDENSTSKNSTPKEQNVSNYFDNSLDTNVSGTTSQVA